MSEKIRYRSTFYFKSKRYETRSSISQRDADQKAALKKHQLENGEVGVSSNMTVKAWADLWLETYKKPSVGKGQFGNLRCYINNCIVPDIGNRKISEVTEIELQNILNNKVGYSKSYCTKLHQTIRAIFTKAHSSRLIPYNPALNLEIPKSFDKKRRSVTDYERDKILEVAENHYAGLWVKLILYCGLRPGETRALDWRHIDFDKKLIKVEVAMKTKTKQISEPKTEDGFRLVPIPNTLLDDLLKTKGNPFDPVIKNRISGNRYSEDKMYDMWLSFKRDLDISMGAKLYRNKIQISVVADDLVPYCLRHTYCTDLQRAGVPINVARYLMGHKNIATTAQIYTDTTEDVIVTAAKNINEYHLVANK